MEDINKSLKKLRAEAKRQQKLSEKEALEKQIKKANLQRTLKYKAGNTLFGIGKKLFNNLADSGEKALNKNTKQLPKKFKHLA